MENTDNLSILYIGNNVAVLNLLSTDQRFQVIQSSNGLQAINTLSNGEFLLFTEKDPDIKPVYTCNQKFDAIICDKHLPGMNAFNLFLMLRKANLCTFLPFIVITDKFDFNHRKLAYEIGMSDYFSMPINSDSLYERIKFLKVYFKEYIPRKTEEVDIELVSYKTPLPKRIFDITMVTLALIPLIPIMSLVALAIRLESKGPVVYKSKRVGANFKVFDFLKFRSMYPDADRRLKEVEHLNQYVAEKVEEKCSKCNELPEGQYCSPLVYYDGEQICERIAIQRKNAKKAFLKIQNDPRITKVGKLIRNTSIDELPQLFNILKGDMSIVGNRPLPVNEANAITKSKWARRFQAAAGLTGLWQVELRGRSGEMSEEERFMLDNEYASNNSFWGDIALILRTLKIFIQKGSV